MADLPPFGSLTCLKCGDNRPSATYEPAYHRPDPSGFQVAMLHGCGWSYPRCSQAEHIHRKCVCGWWWAEQTKDGSPDKGEPAPGESERGSIELVQP